MGTTGGGERGGRADAQVGVPPRNAAERLLCRLEEWLYDLNARNHWLFLVYDWGNEIWARVAFRGVRRLAAGFDVEIEGRAGRRARLRFLTPDDEEAFAGLLARFDFAHQPPHPLDRGTAHRVLRRANHLPFGIFDREGRMIGYALVRLFFPRRAATGVWTLPADPERGIHSQGLSRAAVRATAQELMRGTGVADYCTVGLDNEPSLRAAEFAGWVVIRTNRRFHVMLQRHCLRDGS